MPSLNLDLTYFSHPKTRRLVGLLGKGSEVLPIQLWCYCGMHHAESGRLAGYSTQEIEAICAWWGKGGEMVAAMLKVGFIETLGGEAGGYQVHDWTDHAGHLAVYQERAKAARQAQLDKKRLEAGLKPAKNENKPGQCSAVQGREREEAYASSCGEHGQGRLPAGSAVRILVSFPLPGEQGEIPVTDERLADWQAAYPGGDIPAALAKMRSWLISNPKRRKTKSGVLQFINNWLSKEQNRPAGRPGQTPAAQVSAEARELGVYYLEKHEPSYGANATETMKDGFCAMNAATLQGLISVAGDVKVAQRALDLVAQFKAGKPWQLKFISDIWPEFVGEAMKEGANAGTR